VSGLNCDSVTVKGTADQCSQQTGAYFDTVKITHSFPTRKVQDKAGTATILEANHYTASYKKFSASDGSQIQGSLVLQKSYVPEIHCAN